MYTTIHDVTLNSLKHHATLIHYFGLGFIQIKLTNEYRMHFYTSKLPAIVGEEDIHNHRYDFTSHILYGQLFQELFTLCDGVSHLCESESCKKGVRANTPSYPCSIKKTGEQIFSVGSTYSISHEIFHRVKSLECITLLERGPIKKDLADVVRPINAPSICPFSLTVPEDHLWSLVESMLHKAQS